MVADHLPLAVFFTGRGRHTGKHNRAIDAAKGLARSEAENADRLSRVRHGTLEAKTLREIKAGQLKKSGVSLQMKQTERSPGLRRRASGPRKMFAGGSGGCVFVLERRQQRTGSEGDAGAGGKLRLPSSVSAPPIGTLSRWRFLPPSTPSFCC